ncbi:MAG: hypothetical protein J2P57_08580 [Acidimicrobiaceae bacterium]|nr:hypothetical protein [Acidimicrobiaceae bacterium]
MNQPSTSYEVRFWKVSVRKGARATAYRVRWSVGGQVHSETFATSKLADSFRSGLVTAARSGEAFDVKTGLPASRGARSRRRLWVELAREFIDAKWDEFSPRHRKSTVEGLVTLTCALVGDGQTPPDPAALRLALTQWEFNSAARRRRGEPPAEYAEPLRWIASNSLPLELVAEPDGMRAALKSLATRLDGSRASAATVARKRAALSGALNHAVDENYLQHNPLREIRSKRERTAEAIDARVVVNPEQARALLRAVWEIEPTVHAFFACLYYAALRPAEARNLRRADLTLPESGWGQIVLHSGYQESGAAWTDAGTSGEERHLKHRARNETRPVPAHPVLVAALRTHLDDFQTGVGGRLFVSARVVVVTQSLPRTRTR